MILYYETSLLETIMRFHIEPILFCKIMRLKQAGGDAQYLIPNDSNDHSSIYQMDTK